MASAHQEPCFLAPPDNPVDPDARCNRPYPRMEVGMHVVAAIDPYPAPGRIVHDHVVAPQANPTLAQPQEAKAPPTMIAGPKRMAAPIA